MCEVLLLIVSAFCGLTLAEDNSSADAGNAGTFSRKPSTTPRSDVGETGFGIEEVDSLV